MELILAVDLRGGLVVHGAAGARETYRPLDWGLAPSAEPEEYLTALRPRHVYIADLDRIMGTGDHAALIARLAPRVATCYVDAGFASAGRVPGRDGVRAGARDRDGRRTPSATARTASSRSTAATAACSRTARTRSRSLTGCATSHSRAHLYLEIGSVGTGRGIDTALLARVRSASDRRLLYGGGVASDGRPRPARRRRLRRRDRRDRGPPRCDPARRGQEGRVALITLEGIDGTGKSTLVRLLETRLADLDPVFTREPTTAWTGQAVRRGIAEEVDPIAEALLFAADHAAHIATVVRPALAEGRLVVSDRYSDSR